MTRSARLVDDSGATLFVLDSDTLPGSYVLTALDLGFPTAREATSPLSGQDGELDVTQYVGGRAITGEVALVTDDGSIDTLRGLMHPGRRMWLHVQKDAWSQERRIRVRGAGVTAPMGPPPWTAQLSWKAPGATFQDVTATSVTLNPAAQPGGGIALPQAFPFAFQPGLVPGASNLTVNGTANASPTIDIYGPCSDPLFRVVSTGAQLSFTGLSIQAGSYLHIDTAARTITLNNDPAQSQYNRLDFGTSSWPVLPPGTPQVVFSPTSSSAGCVAVVSWSSQWL